ncbi:MAG: NIPSNAP family protein [Acidobacteria bacterium]|nr:NIPSNAP family protein [Acidobacteriota bacterium]
MDRRSFVGVMGGMTLMNTNQAGAAGAQRTRYYILEHFFLKNGTQPGRMNDFIRDALLPALNKVHTGPKIVMDALVAPQMPQLALILGLRSLEELPSLEAGLWKQEGLRKAAEALEAHAEPPCEHSSAALLEATDYSPEIVPLDPPPKTPRIFELRVYHSPTYRQLQALHERFAGPEIKIFARCGVHPLFYSSTYFGANRPNLTYLIPFDSLAAREKAWAAFAADPEWIKVRKESIEKHGQISSIIQMSLFRATAYSPIR